MGEACSTYWEMRDAYRCLVGKPEEKGPLRRRKGKWEDNIPKYFNELRWEGVDWIRLA
jgi:hypothetical protein